MFLAELLEEDLQGITLVYGPAASGKTTLCLEALQGRSIYVSSGRNFSAERLQSLRLNSPELMERLVLFEPPDLPSWERAVAQAVQLSKLANVIILDTPATAFRSSPRTMGNLALHRMLQELGRAQCPVLLTSEVYDRVEGMYDVQFVGGDMLRLAARTIVELNAGVASVKKHPVHTGRQWKYTIEGEGLVKVTE